MPSPLEQAPAHPPCPLKVWTSIWIPRSNPFRLDRFQYPLGHMSSSTTSVSDPPPPHRRGYANPNHISHHQTLSIIRHIDRRSACPAHHEHSTTRHNIQKAGWSCASPPPTPLLVTNTIFANQRYQFSIFGGTLKSSERLTFFYFLVFA